MKIQYTPYGSLTVEIHTIHTAEINFYPNHLEVVEWYEFTYNYEGVPTDGFVKQAVLFPKHSGSLVRTTRHEEDEHIPCVILKEGTSLAFKTDKEADEVYLTIKNWLIKPQ